MTDPAFLFYSSDFLSGVSDLTMEERGQFITLLCLQHQKGALSEKTIRLSVGSASVDVMNKFRLLENGDYVNDRLLEETKKRAIYTQSRRENGKKGGRPVKIKEKKENNNHMQNQSDSIQKPYGHDMLNHMGNRDINGNIIINEIEKGVQGEKQISENFWPQNPKFNDPADAGVLPGADDNDWNLFCLQYKVKPTNLDDIFQAYQLNCKSQDVHRDRNQHLAAFAKWCLTWHRNDLKSKNGVSSRHDKKSASESKIDALIELYS